MPSAAQPLARERQERQVTVPSSATEPVPELHVAPSTITLVHFDAPIDRASVEVEGQTTRFRVVDVGDSIIALEPLFELGDGERLGVRIRYRDAAAPTQAVLALASHPTRVDVRVEVFRRSRSRDALLAALAEKEAELTTLRARCGEGGLPGLVFSGELDSKDIRARPFWGTPPPGYQGGLEPRSGTGYRATHWAMVTIHVRNLPGQKPWAVGTARLTSAAGTQVKVRSVHMQKPQLQAGETGRVVVVTEPLNPSEEFFRLELVDTEGGRRLPISNVNFRGLLP